MDDFHNTGLASILTWTIHGSLPLGSHLFREWKNNLSFLPHSFLFFFSCFFETMCFISWDNDWEGDFLDSILIPLYIDASFF